VFVPVPAPIPVEWAKKVGLGYDLPINDPALIGLRGVQTIENLKQTEAT
jgi:hypothetical protein